MTDTFSPADHRWMRRALTLAERGLYTTRANPRVGCVLVRNGQLLGEGFHVRPGEGHAEVEALRDADGDARGATAYVTLEPCSFFGRTPPCSQALIEAGVARVIVALRDPNPQVDGGGLADLRRAGIGTTIGLLADEARAQNPGFIKRMAQGVPFFRVKLAASLDGHTALDNGDSRWITGPAARDDVQHLRARACAVLSGADTVLVDNPSLTVRINGRGLAVDEHHSDLAQPLRVIIDGAGRLNARLKTFALPGNVVIATTTKAAPKLAPIATSGVDIWAFESPRVPLVKLAERLAEQGVNEVHTECGPRLAGALLNAGLLDELIVYIAPLLLGAGAAPLIDHPSICEMTQRTVLDLIDVKRVGDDVRLTLRPSPH
ncbi:MAG: bifunctional diaminohydroxyphosphoribosylaminopyrimidine deaminase/5-amino-6-(5-phosphoribosylamino)uracil reductase RibD [Chromatiales bacterium]|jgi:diaminohydroxyphosphoribosylaminopyrimidine deaminase / 5-amino-6-(5-phosphoribosylamino)uracil reductase|nr:bifunctional diaminohydroxyphosphoribosylaminopyrimidine deaminase/5-amino-6-(5-phosphoribosylamino)uracil reductase RibD [Chromatiales bacterium]